MENSKALQEKLTFAVVIIGILFLLIVFLAAAYLFRNSDKAAENIVAVLGAVTGVLGTLIGYVAGQSGKDRAEQKAAAAEQRLTAIVDKSDKSVIAAAKSDYPNLFKGW